MRCKLCEMLTDQQQNVGLLNHHHGQQQQQQQQLHASNPFWPPQFGLRDLMLAAYLLRGYYQPAGPLISSHHHLHSAAAASGVANPGKAPAVLPILEASATPTPPPSAASHSVPPSQIVSSNSTPSGTTRGGDESSDNDVIITATSCSSGGGEVITQQQPASAYRYPAAYPPPTATTPHYAYPYTQHYPSPPASASVQYSGPHHYHAQDLCYSGYPAATAPPPYFHHKAYSTPPPAAYHRRYLVPPAPQYYASELYPAAAPTASAPTPPQQNASSQSTPQATQQMVVAGGGSYLPAPREHAPPPLVESYPPPPPIVDPYPPPPGYYTGYGAAPGSAACYTHSPPSRGLAFIDSAYPSCPCPMQSCPKNVHTGPLTGDGKGSHLLSKQQQPLPPVVLALPLEPPGALGPPSPARGSAGISQPPTPATASVRNPNVLAEEDCTPFTWSTEAQLDKQESSQQEKQLAEDTPQTTVVTCSERDFSDVTTLPDLTEDMSQHRLLTIMKPACENPLSRRSSADSVNGSKNVPLLMCDKFQSRNTNASTADEESVGLVARGETDSVKHEGKSVEMDASVIKSANSAATEQELNISKVETNQKRKLEVNDSDKSEKLQLPAPKRQKCSKNSKVVSSASQDQNSVKKENMFPKIVSPSQDNATKKTAPLSSNNNTVMTVKPCPKKRKLEDSKDSCENAEPVTPSAKKQKLAMKMSKNPKDLKTKTYPSRAKQLKDKCGANCNSRNSNLINVNVLDSALCRNRTLINTSTKKSNLPTVPVENGKMPTTKVECKPKVNGSTVPQKKHTLRKPKQSDLVGDVPTTLPATSSKARRKNSSTVDTNNVVNKPSGKKSNNLLQSQQRLESLSEEETEIIPKVLCVGGVRRPSLTVNKKEQLKGQVRKTVKPSSEILEQQKAGVVTALSRKAPLKRSAVVTPKWSNGWSWDGEPFYAKVFLSSDDAPQMRKCYPSMRHIEGDIICPRDCVLLKSGTRKIDLPFIAKVAALWENQDDGEMMVSLLWYYRPEHTDQGRREEHMEDEVFASKHKDTNSVACIEDKCYVLTFNEYCRFRKNQRRQEEGVRDPALVVPQSEGYVRTSRQPPSCVAPDMVFFCRKVYDFRQRRILKNPG